MTIQGNHKALFLAGLFSGPVPAVHAAGSQDVQQLFEEKCSRCHAVSEKTLGPAIREMSKAPDVLREAIVKGKNAMHGFGALLSAPEIDALVKYLLAQQQTAPLPEK